MRLLDVDLGRAYFYTNLGGTLATLEDFGRRCGLFHDSQPYQRPQAAASSRYGPDSYIMVNFSCAPRPQTLCNVTDWSSPQVALTTILLAFFHPRMEL